MDFSFRKFVRFSLFAYLLAGLCFGLHPVLASAQTLRLAIAGEPSSLDPHNANLQLNNAIARHIFDTLVRVDFDRGVLVPGIASSWRSVDALNWEFKLRRDIRFHDGSELTADDVIASLKRPDVIKTANGFTGSTRRFAEISAPDAYTVRIRTREPAPGIPGSVGTIFIIPKAMAGMSVEEFNSGKAAIGSGPYKVVRWQRGERLELARHPQYWDGPVQWEKLLLRPFDTGTARVAALLAGDVDAIEHVPAQDMSRLASQPNLRVLAKESYNTSYLQLDMGRDVTPMVRDLDGNLLKQNPLKDVRVRRALSLAIDRQAIADRVAEGLTVPAGNLIPVNLSTSSGLAPDTYDLAQAKKLLAEAGYPQGFALTLHATVTPGTLGEKICQSIAAMWSRAGVKTELFGHPWAIFYPKSQKREMSAMIMGMGSSWHMGGYLRALAHSVDAEKGDGSLNLGLYSNPALDALIERASSEIDESKNIPLWRQAGALAMKDYAVVPLFHSKSNWAMRNNLRLTPHMDGASYAQDFVLEKAP